ncbi:hypothetical protein B0T12DRAFT_128793 [Alternaria alternata]|nr:hypothetical protein B0T12DRAFT_128793 [Alternaria alternata]
MISLSARRTSSSPVKYLCIAEHISTHRSQKVGSEASSNPLRSWSIAGGASTIQKMQCQAAKTVYHRRELDLCRSIARRHEWGRRSWKFHKFMRHRRGIKIRQNVVAWRAGWQLRRHWATAYEDR